MRTPLPYYGAKVNFSRRFSLPIKAHDVYLEPFCGSAAFFFEKPKALKVEQLSDTNRWMIDSLTAVRDHPFDLIERLPKCTPEDLERASCIEDPKEWIEALPKGFNRSDWQSAVDRVHNDDLSDDVVENAVIQLAAWWMSFNATPWSRAQSSKQVGYYVNAVSTGVLAERIISGSERLRGVGIDRMDALEALSLTEGDTLAFLDPPYMRRGKGASRTASYPGYGDYEPDEEWHHRLLDSVESALGRGAELIITTGMDDLYRERLSGMGLKMLTVYGQKAGAGAGSGGTGRAQHYVWASHGAVEAVESPRLI